MFISTKVQFIIAFGLTGSSWLIYLFYTRYFARAKRKLILSKAEKDYYYHTVFTTLKSQQCREHMNTREECSETCSYLYLQKIVKFLSSANHSICFCMYTASIETVMDELLNIAHNKGIRVRVITDWEMTRTSKNIYQMCKSSGLMEIKTQNKKELSMMHHKFCLVDENQNEDAKMFFGSLNMTMQGLCGNFEHVLFTNDRQFIGAFKDEFEYLWSNLKTLDG